MKVEYDSDKEGVKIVTKFNYCYSVSDIMLHSCPDSNLVIFHGAIMVKIFVLFRNK